MSELQTIICYSVSMSCDKYNWIDGNHSIYSNRRRVFSERERSSKYKEKR